MLLINLPENVVSRGSRGSVLLSIKPFSREKVVKSTGHGEPTLGFMFVVMVVIRAPFLFETQFGNRVHEPFRHVMFSGPPIFSCSFLHIIEMYAPDNA